MAGLESAKSKNYEEAFTCFLAAAQQGYSKAQFNAGVCYEKGRGVSKDKAKVTIQTHTLVSWVFRHHSSPTSEISLDLILVSFLFKALCYYWQAAVGGHRQAQYRYAKLLLTSRGHQSLEELNMAISLLEQSAAAGLTKVEIMTKSSKCLFILP